MGFGKFLHVISNRNFQNIFLVFFLGLSVFLFFSALKGGESFELFRMSVQKNIFFGAVVFLALETVSIVIAPVTTIFLIPVAAGIFGAFLTAILSVLGWTAGSAIAFLLARRLGRPVLEKMVNPEKLEKYRNYVSVDAEFLTLIILRVILPVDVLSYAVGLFTVMRFRKYLLATIIGITPFSFIYSFGGDALIKGEYLKLAYVFTGAAIFLVFVGVVFSGGRKFGKRRR